jgi:hypothetical protein
MGSLGSLGVAHAETPAKEGAEPDTFEWFGFTLRAVEEVDEVELVDVMASFHAIESEGIAAIGAIKEGLQMLIHPDDFGTFWRLARQNKQKIEDLMEAFRVLLYRPTDRPIQRQSDSSIGLPVTTESLPVDSPSPGSAGRPDRQIIHDDHEEWRQRRAMALVAG